MKLIKSTYFAAAIPDGVVVSRPNWHSYNYKAMVQNGVQEELI
jgi:hypothetical protein